MQGFNEEPGAKYLIFHIFHKNQTLVAMAIFLKVFPHFPGTTTAFSIFLRFSAFR
jgi:hypothetical protein